MNKYLFFPLLLIVTSLLLFSSCTKTIPGCTDSSASNFNPDANEDNGTCVFPGCSDPLAINFNPSANEDDGSCITFLGTWDVVRFAYDGFDWIGAALMKNVEMEFEDDRDLKFTGEYFDEDLEVFLPFRSEGNWEFDIEDEELNIDWQQGSQLTLCSDPVDFDFDFDGQDELELSLNDCNGDVLTIVLEK